MTQKFFDKWPAEGIQIRDMGLKQYMSVEPRFSMHASGRQAHRQFGKANVSIVERLMNKIMRSGPGNKKIGGRVIRGARACGKKQKAYNIVKGAFMIIESETKENPVQVLVSAIENSAPREETTRISYGGISYHHAVDSSSQRRLDVALKNIAGAAYAASFKNKKGIEECLAEELIYASKGDMKSSAVKRKEETERIARGAR